MNRKVLKISLRYRAVQWWPPVHGGPAPGVAHVPLCQLAASTAGNCSRAQNRFCRVILDGWKWLFLFFCTFLFSHEVFRMRIWSFIILCWPVINFKWLFFGADPTSGCHSCYVIPVFSGVADNMITTARVKFEEDTSGITPYYFFHLNNFTS
jgi:hypothetical protein